MRILYALNSSQHGGMEHHVLDLIEGMHAKGHEVYVWSPDGPLTEIFIRLGAKHTVKHLNYELDFSYILALKTFLLQNKIDVVHAHELKAVTNALLAAKLANVKVRVAHTHTPISEWQINPIKKLVNIIFDSVFINLFASVEIALTNSRKKVKMKEGIASNKLAVIPNCIHQDKFNTLIDSKAKFRSEIIQRYKIPESAFILGNVSRLSSEKGHRVLIDAFKKTSIKNKFLLLAGGGPLEAEIRQYIKEQGLEDLVIITGRFAEEDLLKFYATFDVFVHPTLAEGFGIVLIEAMAAKLPVICSDLPVLQEVAADAVVYFETGNSNALAASLTAFKRDDSMILRAYNLVMDKYSFEQFINNYEKLYLDIFNERKN